MSGDIQAERLRAMQAGTVEAMRAAKPTDDWCSTCGRQTPHAGISDAVCDQCRAIEGKTIPGTARVLLTDLAAQTREVEHLRARVTELQARCTALVEEKRALDWCAQVRQLFVCFEQEQPLMPCWPDDKTLRLRRKMTVEEHTELVDALDRRDMVETVDGVIDSIVVDLGLLVAMGIDPRPFWTAIHESNIKKRGGPKSADGKMMKRADWVPPDIAGLLREQGWRP